MKSKLLNITILAIFLLSLTSFNSKFNYNKEYDYHFERNYELFWKDDSVIIWHPKDLKTDERHGRRVFINEKPKLNLKVKMDSILNTIK